MAEKEDRRKETKHEKENRSGRTEERKSKSKEYEEGRRQTEMRERSATKPTRRQFVTIQVVREYRRKLYAEVRFGAD